MSYENVDHLDIAEDLILGQWQGEDMEKLILALVSPLQKIENDNEALQNQRWIDTAIGDQLDGCGDILGQTRLVNANLSFKYFGFLETDGAKGTFDGAPWYFKGATLSEGTKLDDDVYRKVLKAKAIKNTTYGTLSDIILVLRTVLNATNPIIIETGNATIDIVIDGLISSEQWNLVSELNLLPVASGVKIRNVCASYNPSAVFGFAENGNAGFGQAPFWIKENLN